MLREPPSNPPPGVSRRGVLLGLVGVAGAGTLAGCGLFGHDSPAPGPLPHVLVDFYLGTVALVEQYEAALTAVPALAPLITPVHDNHVAHRDALAKALAPLPSTTAPAASTVPTDRTAALAALVTAENTGRDAAIQACQSAPDHLASLVGAIAAARASHVIALS